MKGLSFFPAVAAEGDPPPRTKSPTPTPLPVPAQPAPPVNLHRDAQPAVGPSAQTKLPSASADGNDMDGGDTTDLSDVGTLLGVIGVAGAHIPHDDVLSAPPPLCQ